MSVSLVLVALWALMANLLAMAPSRDNHWRLAYWLIVTGIPILGLVTLQHGPWLGFAALGLGMWILRWPVIRLVHWMRRRGRKG